MDKAKRLLEGVGAQKTTPEKRITLAVELAALLIDEARRRIDLQEAEARRLVAGMVKDPSGKVFVMRMTDQCFRSADAMRAADQLAFLLRRYGIPSFFPWLHRLQLAGFRLFGRLFPRLCIGLAKKAVREEAATVILPGEEVVLLNHIRRREQEGVQVNLNHLGEAILGEEEALRRLQMYIDDLSREEVRYVSVKISTIASQLNLTAREQTLELLEIRLKRLYRAAMQQKKFVNLDMEEYRDLDLTVDLFMRVLNDPEFHSFRAGIVLQSYLPDAFLYQMQLTEWAMSRVKEGRAPIKIRLVKGANLAMERVDSSIANRPQAPFPDKLSVDACYKTMVSYACDPVHAAAAHVGIASHNVFDIAYALVLRSENGVERYVDFEMLEGMVDSLRQVVQELAGEMVLYCPAAAEREFVNAVAYLVRRLDENTAPENFLSHIFDIVPGSEEWKSQKQMFEASCTLIGHLDHQPRRRQDRTLPEIPSAVFENEQDTDWALEQNVNWGRRIIERVRQYPAEEIPVTIGNETVLRPVAEGANPSSPGNVPFRYTLADEQLIAKALTCAHNEKCDLRKTADLFRQGRAALIEAMVVEGGKTIAQADTEVSEAIDLIEYYQQTSEELRALDDLRWSPKGTVLVAPPWNFPCAIPTGGIAAALAAGNCVLFKPAPQAVLSGWRIVNLFWNAGVDKHALQFIPCAEEPVGSALIKDPRVAAVVLTGATETARAFLTMRPDLDLIAETGGKNSIIVTAMADRDLAIKSIIDSAFLHAGQKCSACSLAILEAEVYDDPHFKRQLLDAARSMPVGPSTDPWNIVTPLIMPPSGNLLRGLLTLEPGEEWALQPKCNNSNPCLWGPGIKWGVQEGSFTHQTELFGPVLGVMRANDLQHALRLANSTPYGLTAGLQSLDVREQEYWIKHIEAGNLYINRGITGAVVQRQPFGGCKASSFGRGAKAGGPNYVAQLMTARQISPPAKKSLVPSEVEALTRNIPIDRTRWDAATGSYAYYWHQYFSKDHDPALLIGQDNIFRYVPQRLTHLRVASTDDLTDVLLVKAAALICGARLEVSVDGSRRLPPCFSCVRESDEQFIQRLKAGEIQRLRLLSPPDAALWRARNDCDLLIGPVLANGRIELLNYLREVSISNNYHRYGNLGSREAEKRHPLPD